MSVPIIHQYNCNDVIVHIIIICSVFLFMAPALPVTSDRDEPPAINVCYLLLVILHLESITSTSLGLLAHGHG